MASSTKEKRGNIDAKHVRIYDGMQKTAAWKAMSGNAVKLLLHLASFESPKSSPNGSLFLSNAAAAEGIGVSKKTACYLFHELVELGFIRATAKGYFQMKGGPATCWRMTWRPWPGHMGATHEYRDWSPEKSKLGSKFYTRTNVEITPRPVLTTPIGVKSTTAETTKAQNCIAKIGVKITPHTIAIGRDQLTSEGPPS